MASNGQNLFSTFPTPSANLAVCGITRNDGNYYLATTEVGQTYTPGGIDFEILSSGGSSDLTVTLRCQVGTASSISVYLNGVAQAAPTGGTTNTFSVWTLASGLNTATHYHVAVRFLGITYFELTPASGNHITASSASASGVTIQLPTNGSGFAVAQSSMQWMTPISLFSSGSTPWLTSSASVEISPGWLWGSSGQPNFGYTQINDAPIRVTTKVTQGAAIWVYTKCNASWWGCSFGGEDINIIQLPATNNWDWVMLGQLNPLSSNEVNVTADWAIYPIKTDASTNAFTSLGGIMCTVPNGTSTSGLGFQTTINKSKRIGFAGDSIMEKIRAFGSATTVNSTARLVSKMTGYTTCNAAYGGANFQDNLSSQITALTGSTVVPTEIVVRMGTNDAFLGRSSSSITTAMASAATTFLATAATGNLYFMAITSRLSFSPATINTYNGYIKAGIASINNARVRFLDTQLATTTSDLTADNVHFQDIANIKDALQIAAVFGAPVPTVATSYGVSVGNATVGKAATITASLNGTCPPGAVITIVATSNETITPIAIAAGSSFGTTTWIPAVSGSITLSATSVVNGTYAANSSNYNVGSLTDPNSQAISVSAIAGGRRHVGSL